MLIANPTEISHKVPDKTEQKYWIFSENSLQLVNSMARDLLTAESWTVLRASRLGHSWFLELADHSNQQLRGWMYGMIERMDERKRSIYMRWTYVRCSKSSSSNRSLRHIMSSLLNQALGSSAQSWHITLLLLYTTSWSGFVSNLALNILPLSQTHCP